jgi:hypothetical protein
MREVTWDMRATAVKRGERSRLSILAKGGFREEAENAAIQALITQGWEDVLIEWCIVYPPHRTKRPSRAISDD